VVGGSENRRAAVVAYVYIGVAGSSGHTHENIFVRLSMPRENVCLVLP